MKEIILSNLQFISNLFYLLEKKNVFPRESEINEEKPIN